MKKIIFILPFLLFVKAEEIKEKIIFTKDDTIFVLDQEKEELKSAFTYGKINSLHATNNYIYATHDNRVTVLDAGIFSISHGDHQDLKKTNPFVRTTLNIGNDPKFVFSGDEIGFFTNGVLNILPENLIAVNNDMTVLDTAYYEYKFILKDDKYIYVANKNNKINVYDLELEKNIENYECNANSANKINKGVIFTCNGFNLFLEKGKIYKKQTNDMNISKIEQYKNDFYFLKDKSELYKNHNLISKAKNFIIKNDDLYIFNNSNIKIINLDLNKSHTIDVDLQGYDLNTAKIGKNIWIKGKDKIIMINDQKQQEFNYSADFIEVMSAKGVIH